MSTLEIIAGMKSPAKTLEDTLSNDLFFALADFAVSKQIKIHDRPRIFEIADGWWGAFAPPAHRDMQFAVELPNLSYVKIPSSGFAVWHNGRPSMIGFMDELYTLPSYRDKDHERLCYLLDTLNNQNHVRTQAVS